MLSWATRVELTIYSAPHEKEAATNEFILRSPEDLVGNALAFVLQANAWSEPQQHHVMHVALEQKRNRCSDLRYCTRCTFAEARLGDMETQCDG